jgi:magnesium transporter
MTKERSDTLSLLKAELNQNRLVEAVKLLADLHPADIADLFEALDEHEKKKLFRELDIDTASDVIAELSEFSQDQILADLPHQRLGEIVDELDSDDAADLLASVPDEVAEEVLASIDVEDSREVRRLLAYDEETAGGVMQAELLAVAQEATIADTIKHVREYGKELEGLANIFVVNSDQQVVGQLSLRQLILSEPADTVLQVMDTSVRTIPVAMDQEDVAKMFQKYDLLSAPVIESDGSLVGRITIDDIIDIIEEEISEDVLRMAGTHEDELVYGDQIWKISRFRLPWLLTTLVGGLLTGYLLWLFKVALADAIVLVTFVPVIMALGGSVAIQSTTITVRGLATGAIDLQRIGRTVYKETRVGLLMALACGLTLGIAAEIWHRNPVLGLTVGISMAGVIMVASLMGTLIPVAFQRLGIDPAVSSGPFVTIANDISGIVIYLSISSALLKYIAP